MNSNYVLIIEDDLDLIEDLPRALTYEGIRCIPFSNCAEALEKLRGLTFDCVIMDVKMPPADDMPDEEVDCGRTTGVVVCDRIRKAYPRVPILIFTTVADSHVHQRLRQVGASIILVKPVQTDELVQQVKRLLKR